MRFFGGNGSRVAHSRCFFFTVKNALCAIGNFGQRRKERGAAVITIRNQAHL
jgi:hypothetical protein